MYIPVNALLAARQLAAVAPSTNAARDLSNVMGLLPRQDTAFIPKTDSQAQKDFEAEQAASSAAAAKQTACAVAASAGLPCSREVRRDLANIIATASGVSRRFVSVPQRRQDTAFIPKTDSQEQKDFEAEQAASSAAAAAQTACLVRQSVGLPCTRELNARQDTAFIPKTDSQEQKDFDAQQAASAAAAAAQTACLVRQSAGLPCTRELDARQDTAFIPKTDSQEQKDFDAAQQESIIRNKQQQEELLRQSVEAAQAKAAAEAAASSTSQPAAQPTIKPIGTGIVCIVSPCPGDGSDTGLGGGIFRRFLNRRQKVSFNPKTDSQEQKDFEAAQRESIERVKQQQEETLRKAQEAAQAKADAEKAAQSQPPQSAPAPEATPQPPQSVPPEAAPQPPQSVPPEAAPQPPQSVPPEAAPQPAGDNTGLDFGFGGLLGRALSARQDTAFIPKTDSQAQKDFEAEQAASSAAAAAQTACLVRASVGLPCTREVANLMVRSLIASLD